MTSLGVLCRSAAVLLLTWSTCVASESLSSDFSQDSKLGSTPTFEHAYCQSEYFRVRCAVGEVLVIAHARYGRMRISRCVREHFGYVNCSVDVVAVLDRHCSGRRSCSIRVLDDNFNNVRPCHDDLKSYLQVRHQCVKVEAASRASCDVARRRSPEIHRQSGYLAGVWAAETGCGTVDAPWRVRVEPGQRINVTLFDFNVASTPENNQSLPAAVYVASAADGAVSSPLSTQSSSVPSSSSSSISSGTERRCRAAYAVIRQLPAPAADHDGSGSDGSERRVKVLTLCPGLARRTVYQLDGNIAEITIVGSKTIISSSALLIRFDAVGCGRPGPPAGGWLRHGNGPDDVTLVGCHTSSHQWQLRCHGNVWTLDNGSGAGGINCSTSQGVISEGSQVIGSKQHRIEKSSTMRLVHYLTIGPALIIISSLALIVGLLILFVGVVCLNRKQARLKRLHRVERRRVKLGGHETSVLRTPSALTADTPVDAATTPDATTLYTVTATTPPPLDPDPAGDEQSRAGGVAVSSSPWSPSAVDLIECVECAAELAGKRGIHRCRSSVVQHMPPPPPPPPPAADCSKVGFCTCVRQSRPATTT